MRIKGNKKEDKIAKEAIDMSGVTKIRLPNTDYYLIIKRMSGKIVIVNNTTLNQALKSGSVLTTVVGNMRLS